MYFSLQNGLIHIFSTQHVLSEVMEATGTDGLKHSPKKSSALPMITKTFLIFVEQLLSVFRGQIAGEGCTQM